MRYWWVNHNKTFQQEISGRYLWSPKTEARGVRSQFYDNMRLAAPGDHVLSFARGKVSYLGTVLDFALSAPKPAAFGTTGTNWGDEGWLLSLKWRRLEHPITPRDVIDRLRPLLPSKYSPINHVTGWGNQKAYLAEVDRTVIDLVLARGGVLGATEEPSNSLESIFDLIVERIDDVIAAQVSTDTSLSETLREQVIQARRGQGTFRQRVAEIECCCRLTGLTNGSLLVASHMKPWRSCTTAEERLDGYNGLLLAPHVDALFDRGYISFSNEGAVLVSPHLSADDLDKLGLTQAVAARTATFRTEQRKYLEYHRINVYLSATESAVSSGSRGGVQRAVMRRSRL